MVKKYNPYKATVDSIAEMCNKYENAMRNEEDARDFLHNVKVKCKDAQEYDGIIDKQNYI